MRLVFNIILALCIWDIAYAVATNTVKNDKYGIKIIANDDLFIQFNNDQETLLLKSGPFLTWSTSSRCSTGLNSSLYYVYTIGVGIKQNMTETPYIYFIGEITQTDVATTASSPDVSTFIGIWNIQNVQMIEPESDERSIVCNNLRIDEIQYITSTKHQEFITMAVEPYGRYAVGITTEFLFIYQPQRNESIRIQSTEAFWPYTANFYPYAADIGENVTLVAGFGYDYNRLPTTSITTIYLISNSDLSVTSSWIYAPKPGSWQSGFALYNVNLWNNKYVMSIKFNPDDPTRALAGMSFLSTAFLFTIDNNFTTLTLVTSRGIGELLGYGRSVAWLGTTVVAILSSTIPFENIVSYPSRVFLYTLQNELLIPSFATNVFPNSQQPLPPAMNSLLNFLISTPTSLVILDVDGGTLILTSLPAGYYPATDMLKYTPSYTMPFVGPPATCLGGTYKADTGVHPCTICPSGSRNPGSLQATSCFDCSPDSFCPLGAVYEMNRTVLDSRSQAYAYPRTPEVDVFEDILLYNMFNFGSEAKCILVSPVFWTAMVLLMFVISTVILILITFCVEKDRSTKWWNMIKNVFRRADLIEQGELWIGGVASILVLLVSAMAYAFAVSFLNEYPYEKSGPLKLACDSGIRNTRFQTSLQSLSVPVSDVEQTVFLLLDEQNFTLRVDFINTLIVCDSVSVAELMQPSTKTPMTYSCSWNNGTLSVNIGLLKHEINVLITLDSMDLVGGVGVGMFGASETIGQNTLKELNFLRTIYSQSPKTLSHKSTVQLLLSKVVNETEMLSANDFEFEGIWYPTFKYNLNEMFIGADVYKYVEVGASKTFEISIGETPYYIKNVQSPIAKKPEIVFRTLLFAFLCLEICEITFLVSKLLVIPILNAIIQRIIAKRQKKVEPIELEEKIEKEDTIECKNVIDESLNDDSLKV